MDKISKRNVVARNTGASLKLGELARYKVRFVIGNCTVETIERREKTRFPPTPPPPPPLVYEPDRRILPVTQRAIPAIAVPLVPLVSDRASSFVREIKRETRVQFLDECKCRDMI